MTAAAALALAAAILAPGPQVRDWPGSGGFEVLQLDDSCAIFSTYEFDGRSPVELTVFFDGEKVRLLLTSMDWSNREDQTYPMVYLLGDHGFEGDVPGIVVGYVKKGFVARFGEDFLADFAQAPDLMVMTGETVVTHLSLRGSAAAVGTLRRCTDYVLRQNAEQARREARWDYIAPDPFAPPPPPSTPPRPAQAGVPEWDRPPAPVFPDRALSRGVKAGVVELSCTASPSGSVTDCSIVSETPSGMGFGQSAVRSVASARVSETWLRAYADDARIRFSVTFSAP